MTLKANSYCKTNLFLYITGKSGGYHNLYTLFTKINFYDTITMERCDQFEIVLNNYTKTPMEFEQTSNIIYKTYEFISKKFGIKRPVRVTLDKHTFLGGGLGGGSGNAATFVDLYSHYYDVKLSFEDKLNIMSAVGSDTPYMLYERPLIGSGRGIVLTPAPVVDDISAIIVNPNIELSTGAVFKKLAGRFSVPPISLPQRIGFGNLNDILHNDLEQVSIELLPMIKTIKDALTTLGCDTHIMSGSGATVIAFFENDKKRDELYTKLNDYILANKFIWTAKKTNIIGG